MSYHEKSSAISLTTMLLILFYYSSNLWQMLQDGGLIPSRIFGIWVTIIATAILGNIVSHIVTYIAFYILQYINTGEEEEEITVADERDKLIELKGVRNAYVVSSIGILIAMITFVMNFSPIVMFSLIIFAGLVAQIIGDVSRLYLYRRGF